MTACERQRKRRAEAKARREAAGFTGREPRRTRAEILEDRFLWMRERMTEARIQRLIRQAAIMRAAKNGAR